MIAETITVTTTPTSILDLILTARGVTTLGKSDAVTELLFRTATDGTDTVYISEADTVTPVKLLDPSDSLDPQSKASYSDFELSKTLLSSGSGDVLVGFIASQNGHRV